MSVDNFERPNGPLGNGWLAWAGGAPKIAGGAAVADGGGFDDATRPEVAGANDPVIAYFGSPLTAGMNIGVGARLTAHSNAANGYMLEVRDLGGGAEAKLYKGSGLADLATAASIPPGPIDAAMIVPDDDRITGWLRINGVWTRVVAATDDDYPGPGFPGFWVLGDRGVASVTWGLPDGPAALRFYGRLEPVAYDDPAREYALLKVASAIMAPRELLEVARQDDGHDHPWGALLDPDATPAALLDWLAVFAGIELPPSALTETEKRYRILQAAGRYRGTPRAVVEELQLVLEGTKTVLLGFHTPDQWHYTVGTLSSETPDTAAAERAILAQKPVGMIADAVTTDDWTWFVLAPNLIAHRELVDGRDSYVIGAPEYPTWLSVVNHFSTWQHLVDNDPDL